MFRIVVGLLIGLLKMEKHVPLTDSIILMVLGFFFHIYELTQVAFTCIQLIILQKEIYASGAVGNNKNRLIC